MTGTLLSMHDVTVVDSAQLRSWDTRDKLRQHLLGKHVTLWVGDEQYSRRCNWKIEGVNWWLGGVSVVLGKYGEPGHCEVNLCSAADLDTGVRPAISDQPAR